MQQGPVGEAGQLVVESTVGKGGLLLVEAELEGAPGLVELADDADEAPVAAETDHPQREVEQPVAHAQAHALLGEDADAPVPPGKVGLRHVGEVGLPDDGVPPLSGEALLFLCCRDLVSGQPAADELGGQPRTGERLAAQREGELVVDQVADLVRPGLEGHTERDPLRTDRRLRCVTLRRGLRESHSLHTTEYRLGRQAP